MSKSIFIRGDEVRSFTEVSERILLVPVQYSQKLLELVNWKVTRKLDVYRNGLNLASHLLLPGFDVEEFPFVLDYGTSNSGGISIKSDYFNLINVKTGSKSNLIRGSAQN